MARILSRAILPILWSVLLRTGLDQSEAVASALLPWRYALRRPLNRVNLTRLFERSRIPVQLSIVAPVCDEAKCIVVVPRPEPEFIANHYREIGSAKYRVECQAEHILGANCPRLISRQDVMLPFWSRESTGTQLEMLGRIKRLRLCDYFAKRNSHTSIVQRDESSVG